MINKHTAAFSIPMTILLLYIVTPVSVSVSLVYLVAMQVHGCYVLTPQVLTRAKERMVVMHPLPRVDEIR